MGRGWYCLHRRAFWRVLWQQPDSGQWHGKGHGKGFVSIPLEKTDYTYGPCMELQQTVQASEGAGGLPDNITGMQSCRWHKTTTGQSRQIISNQLTQTVFFL